MVDAMKTYQQIMWLVLVLNFACSANSVMKSSNDAQQFYVQDIQDGGDNMSRTITVLFSKPVLQSTVTADSVFVAHEIDIPESLRQDWVDLSREVSSDDVATLPQSIEWINATTLRLHLTEMIEGSYQIYVLPTVQSELHWPLDQRFNGEDKPYYCFGFHLNASGVSSISSEENSGDVVSESNPSSYPEIYSGGNLSNESETDAVETTEENTEAEEIIPFDWARLLLTEVVTDPQQDFGESTPVNGVLFDSIVGTGTVGSSDEYVEIYNGTPDSVDLSLWSLQMQDGTDEVQGFDDGMELFFSGGGSVQNFQSGEMLVVGNPQGSINNSVTIQLLNETSEIVDDVIIENGNASGLEDEAVFRDADGDWIQGEASPGEF